jgi:hypothetical protein
MFASLRSAVIASSSTTHDRFGSPRPPEETASSIALWNRAAGASALLITCLLAAMACSGTSSKALGYKMGERVPAGSLIYTVLESEWRNELGSKTPIHRFLVLRLTITNSGVRVATPPLLTLVHASGSEYSEVSEVEGLPEWMGLLRRVEPANTDDGKIVFDVPTGVYRLRVSDGGEPGQENTANIEIPLHLETAPSER